MNRATVSSHTDLNIAKTLAFLNLLFPEPRQFAVRLWDGTTFAPAAPARFTLVLNTPGALRRMFRLPLELALGEAFVRGDFDIEGDIFATFELLSRFVSLRAGDLPALARLWLALPTDQAVARNAGSVRAGARLSGQMHSKARDRAAIQYHYDVGNEFYALWLDSRMVYSCAYFPTGSEDLDTAQERKLEHICRKLRLKPGERLLDIGCGWGGLVIYAAQRYDISALGVTLSEQQARLANQRIVEAGLSDRVEVRLLDYRDLADDPANNFDKIVSVGMFEHVGRSHMSEYFEHSYRLLKPGGLFLNHGISVHPSSLHPGGKSLWARFVQRYIYGANSFDRRYVFPDGDLMPVSEVNLRAEHAGFEVRDVENLREHYALTLRHWVTRLEARKAEAIRAVGEAVYRTWRLYMAAAAYGFTAGFINVNQSLLAKPIEGCVELPRSRADLYT